MSWRIADRLRGASSLAFIATSLVAVYGWIATTACSPCDDPADTLTPGRYRLESTAPRNRTRESRTGLSGELFFDADAGTVVVTRTEGGRTIVERWRVVSRGADEDTRMYADVDGGAY